MPRYFSIPVTAMAFGLACTPALADGVTKTWVSSTTGNDAGTCAFTSPCKTFAYAITQTLSGGELDVKDAGSYGIVTINQAVSIVADGVLAAISVPSNGTGVLVAAGANDKVILRGLTIDGHGAGEDGIQYTGGASLIVDHCQVRDFDNAGIDVISNAQSLHVSDTEILNSVSQGISVNAVNRVRGSLLRAGFYNNGSGLVTRNTNIVIIGSIFSGNGTGIISTYAGTILIGQSIVAGNATGISVGYAGSVGSFGNNYIAANTTETTGPIGSIAEQ